MDYDPQLCKCDAWRKTSLTATCYLQTTLLSLLLYMDIGNDYEYEAGTGLIRPIRHTGCDTGYFYVQSQ